MKPPRLAELLIRWSAGRDERADVLGDLADEADLRALSGGDAPARRWYWRQTWRSLGPLIARRLARRQWRAPLWSLGQDLRFVRRSLVRAPAFSLAVIVMLAIGLGAHTVVFAIVDGLVLRPLPFGDRSARLITLHATHPTIERDWTASAISYPDFVDFRAESRTLERLEGALPRNVSLATDDGGATRVAAASVTPGLFSVLGVAPMLGRDFEDADATTAGHESVLIISHGTWRSLLGGNPDILRTTVRVNGRALSVIGVMPPSFSFPEDQQLWLPYRADTGTGRELRSLVGVGLVRRDASIDQASRELTAIAARLAVRFPDTNRDWGVHTATIRESFVSASEATTVLGAISLVLLVACANVAGLLLARGIGRRPELSLRAALGASRRRLIRLVVLEAAVLAAIGGALGLMLAAWGIRAFAAWNPEPPPYWAAPVFDTRVAMFGMALTAAVAVLAGLIPAIRCSRVDNGVLVAGARTVGSPRAQRRLQRVLVIGQVAVSLALLVGAMLLTRSAGALLTADAGFKIESLLSLRFYLAGDRYDTPEARAATIVDIEQRLGTIPAIRAAAATGSIPTDDGGAAIRLLPPHGPAAEVGAQLVPATAHLWQALGLSLVEGRTFTTSELLDASQRVAIVNRRLASRFWPGESAVGRLLRVIEPSGATDFRIIGVSPDLVYEEFLEETPQSQLNVYVPNVHAGWRTHALLINVPADPSGIVDAVRKAIWTIDPGIAVFDVRTMTDRRAFNHWSERFVGRTFSSFAIAALVLAVIGAYGIVAYMAAQRRREIGIRISIGATRGDVLRLFLRDTSRLAIAGGLAGLPLALGLARVLEAHLFRVSPWTTTIWIEPPLLLLAAVLFAGYLPALRASHTDPVEALRGE